MFKTRFIAILLILAGVLIGHFDYTKSVTPPDEEPQLFKLGLDLSGGIYLEYLIDVSSIPSSEVNDSMEALRDLIERRVNMFGVSEPIVQTKQPGLFGSGDGTKEQRLIVQLPGVDNVEKAKEAIGMIPVLEFREHRPSEELKAIIEAKEELRQAVEEQREGFEPNPLAFEDIHVKGSLTGRFLDRASLQFMNSGAVGGEPVVSLEFNKEGAEMFAELTKNNAGGTIPIYVDGEMISEPRVGMQYAQTGITGGTAQISGGFTAESAKDLAWRLNAGALPVDKMGDPVESRSIGATLGEQALYAGVKAGIIGLALVAIFLILWYRLPGLVAVVALGAYIAVMLALFKIVPVALTAAGIAGFILSIGMAVDANILIFERMKEELRAGRTLEDAIREGFSRAWPSIRDGNLSSLITAVILFWFGTSLVEGFALTFGLGIIISMLSAITFSRTFLLAISPSDSDGFVRKLFGSGVSKS